MEVGRGQGHLTDGRQSSKDDDHYVTSETENSPQKVLQTNKDRLLSDEE